MEPNDILPSLKDSLEFDLQILDQYFEKKASSEDYKDRGAAVSWANVREAAISFADMFDRQKDTMIFQKEDEKSHQQHHF